MKCLRCQAEAPADAQFCTACGAAFERPCHRCGVTNAADSRFCKACGRPLTAPPDPRRSLLPTVPEAYTPPHLAERVLTARGALEGERKLVTVLFVDVSGFTALSERLDPEDVHQLMDRAFELMLAEVHRYEGTVNQFLGDGLMALFGAPLAHEDHAVRAVHAALGLRHALAGYRDRLRVERGIEFQVRLGLNTGAVVVGKIGDNLRMDYTAVGDTTNLAARLVGLAEPGQVLVGESTARAVEPYFVLQPLGELAVKGKALPVRPFRVEGARAVRSRLEALMERGLTPLVGRERELALLHDRLSEVQARRGQVVFVFGEPGIGKSRLVLEFRRQVEGSVATWLTGRCVSYGRNISYLPILDLVRGLLGIQESDDVEAMDRKIRVGPIARGAELDWTVPFLRSLLSLNPCDPAVAAMSAHQRRGRIVDAVCALVLATSRDAPTVLVVEDLHWIDPHSEEVLRLILEEVATAPVLVLLTHRPGYTPPFVDQTYHTRITLRALAGDLTAVMVDRVLQVPGVPVPVRDLIARRAEGNPLFVEELARALIEDGTLVEDNGGYRLARSLADAAIPGTIQGVIMARIDRLPEASKTALQVASVIGREFTARLVERVSAMEAQAAGALGELRTVELIYQKAAYPELAYMFKHALTHDVAYESLLRQRRRALHRRAGEVIEELYADRLPALFETLAWHFTEGEAWDRAADYLLKAATKARAHYAYGQAIRYSEQALDIVDRHGGTGPTRLLALEMLGDLQSLQGYVELANRAYHLAAEIAPDAVAQQRIANKRHRAGTASREGAAIGYYEHGSGSPTLFLMHPVFYGLGTNQPLLELLCQEFRLVTVEPRGIGRSSPLPAVYLMRDYVEDARAVIEATGSGSVVFVGNSRAGQLAVNFVTAYPHLVEKMLLISTQPAPTAVMEFPGVDQQFWGRLRPLLEAEDWDRAIPLFWAQAVSEPGGRDLVESLVRNSRETPAEVYRMFFNVNDPGRDVRALLRGVRAPTLVLHGEEDRLVPLEAGRYLARQIPGAQLYVFKGRGHLLAFTATAEFAQVVRHFVRTGRPE